MDPNQTIDGRQFAEMLRAGAAELSANVAEINDLNVFPIPDGDTGSNMLLTIMGGVDALHGEEADISSVARTAADGMLLAARGNSGVILSQLFDGIAKGLEGAPVASAQRLSASLHSGVSCAYSAVLKPTEGTILTVARCAAENADGYASGSPTSYLTSYIAEAKKALAQTPEMLPVLKKAGVIDSGGAGLVHILEGMNKVLTGDPYTATQAPLPVGQSAALDLDKFTQDSVLTYGYCTEVLLRLQSAKTDVDAFDVRVITDYLQTIGDSVVAFKNGSAVKLHVHTRTPDKVLAFCQQYGEFLTTKIENMSLQHSNASDLLPPLPEDNAPRKKYGVIAVLSGEGIQEMFRQRGVDAIVDGGQSMNPSAEDFLRAFSQVRAEHIFLLPNNSNVILAAEQAAGMYHAADVRVLPSRTVGEGFAALAMMNPDEPDAAQVAQDMTQAMSGVATAEISRCIRSADLDGTALHAGDYIGICGKTLLAAAPNRLDAAEKSIDSLSMAAYDICLILVGAEADAAEAGQLAEYIRSDYLGKEVYIVDGKQDVYDYILILQ